jgi:hypothetical protein
MCEKNRLAFLASFAVSPVARAAEEKAFSGFADTGI